MDSREFVFVVDEDCSSRKRVASLVSTVPCRDFASPKEFLESFDPRCIGCIVTDLGPGETEIRKRIAATVGTFEIVIASSHPKVADTVEAMRNGAFTVIEKHCADEELRSAIHHALDRARRLHAERLRATGIRARFESLSEREKSVLDLIVSGEPNKMIAKKLGISQRTVNRARADIYEKLGVGTAVEAARLITEITARKE